MIWNEGILQAHQSRIRGQATSMTLLLQVIQLWVIWWFFIGSLVCARLKYCRISIISWMRKLAYQFDIVLPHKHGKKCSRNLSGNSKVRWTCIFDSPFADVYLYQSNEWRWMFGRRRGGSSVQASKFQRWPIHSTGVQMELRKAGNSKVQREKTRGPERIHAACCNANDHKELVGNGGAERVISQGQSTLQNEFASTDVGCTNSAIVDKRDINGPDSKSPINQDSKFVSSSTYF